MLTLNECKKILNANNDTTDEEIIALRDWLSIMADIAISNLENINIIKETSL